MADHRPISTETVSNMAAEMLRIPLAPADATATAGMLNALASDMQALRHLAVSAEEPATTYAAIEGQP
jgi:hypothetical protein